MPNTLKQQINDYISSKKVFTAIDEREILRRIEDVEENRRVHKKPRAILPQFLSYVGIGILVTIIAGIFLFHAEMLPFSEKQADPGQNPVNEEPSSPAGNDEPDGPSNEYDLTKIKTGDVVAGSWMLLHLASSPDNFKQKTYSAVFEGSIELTGTLICTSEGEYGFAVGTMMFFPDDRSLLPIPKNGDPSKPLLIVQQWQINRDYQLEPGEKKPGVKIKAVTVTNKIDPDSTALADHLTLYTEQEYTGNISPDNAPGEIYREGLPLLKMPSDNSPIAKFAAKSGGVGYYLDGSELSMVLKNREVILRSDLEVDIVSYGYVDEFKEVLQSENVPPETLMFLDEFLASGAPQDKVIDNVRYRISDDAGSLKFEAIHLPKE